MPGSPRPGRVLRPRGGKRGAKEAGEESRWGGSDRGRPAPPAAEPISPPPPQEPASGFLSGFVSSSPSDSNGHRCQWSPQSPALPASWATWRLRVKSPETQTGARRLREWCRPPWEPSRGSETEEWRPAPRRCAHPGRGGGWVRRGGWRGRGNSWTQSCRGSGHCPFFGSKTASDPNVCQLPSDVAGGGAVHTAGGEERGGEQDPVGVRAKLEGLLSTGAPSGPPRTRPPPSARQGPGSLGAAREGCQGGCKPQLCGEPRGHTAAYLRPVPHTQADTLTHFVLALAHTHTHKP